MKKDNLLFYLFILYFVAITLVSSNLGKRINFFSDALLALIILAYIFLTVVNKKSWIEFKDHLDDFFRSTTGILMITTILFMIISISYSLEKKLAISETARLASYISMFFIAKYSIKSNPQINYIIKVVIWLEILLCVFGIIQYFTGFGLSKDFIEQFSFGAKARIAATYGNPNTYAGFLILFLFPTLSLGIKSKNIKEKIIYFTASILNIINIILTFSRNAWAALLLGLVVMVIYYNWKLIFSFFILGVPAFFIPIVRNRMRDFTDINQNISRIHHWKTALLMIKDHPIFGVGNGNYVSYYDSYIAKYPELDFALQKRFPTHNSYLKVISELGILGAIPFIILKVISLFRVKKALNYMKDKSIHAFYSGFLVSLVAFLFMNFFDNLFFVPKATTWFWINLAICEGFIYRFNDRNAFILEENV